MKSLTESHMPDLPFQMRRLGIALEPEADYERWPHCGGGCEDPRVNFVEPIKRYVMSYTAKAEGQEILAKIHRARTAMNKTLGL